MTVLSCTSEDAEFCRPRAFYTPTEYVTYEYNASDKVERIMHYVDEDPSWEKIFYNKNGRVEAVDMVGRDRIVYRRHEVIYDQNTGKPTALHSRVPGSADPPVITNFYHDDMGSLIGMEIPSGNDVMVYRYEYDSNDNVTRVYYKLPGGDEFLGRENLTFDQLRTLHSHHTELSFIDAYVLRRLPLKSNVETALLYSNGPLYRLTTPTVINYQYTYDDDGLILSSHADYHGLIGEYDFSEVRYVCK
jgi:hypothetical protein